MRKLMVLAAVLALMLVTAAPAFAQIGGDQGPVAGGDAVQAGNNVQYAAGSQNILGSFQAEAIQVGFSDADAFAGGNAAAVSEVAQSQNVSVTQTNRSFNGVWWWWF